MPDKSRKKHNSPSKKSDSKSNSVISPNKFDNLKHDSGDSPCRICNDTVYGPDGIMCDRCECWVHSAQKCSELTQAQFKFMVKNKNVAIKFICSKCRVEFPDKMLAPLDAVARQTVKIDTFGEAIAALQLHDCD